MIRGAAAAVVVFASSAVLASSPADGAPASTVEKQGDVTVDWGSGTVSCQAGAAADLHLPSADVARPGAVRRARAAALAKLKGVIANLPLGSDRTLRGEAVERAMARARVSAIEYQSNGGAVISLVAGFTDWLHDAPPRAAPETGVSVDGGSVEALAPPRPADVTITVPAARFAAAPIVKVGKQESALGAATYRLGTPPAAARAVTAKVDRSGRLVLEAPAAIVQKLAGAVAVIYVQKITR